MIAYIGVAAVSFVGCLRMLFAALLFLLKILVPLAIVVLLGFLALLAVAAVHPTLV